MRGLKIVALLALVLTGCRTKVETVEVPVLIHTTDSVRTEVVERVSVDTVTVEIEVPVERESAMAVRDSVSRLETSVATSVAGVRADGTLWHWLENKRGATLSKDVAVTSTDTERVTERVIEKEVPVKYPIYVQVERELTWWQRFRLDAFWWMALAVGALGAWTLRKPIAGIIKRLV